MKRAQATSGSDGFFRRHPELKEVRPSGRHAELKEMRPSGRNTRQARMSKEVILDRHFTFLGHFNPFKYMYK